MCLLYGPIYYTATYVLPFPPAEPTDTPVTLRVSFLTYTGISTFIRYLLNKQHKSYTFFPHYVLKRRHASTPVTVSPGHKHSLKTFS